MTVTVQELPPASRPPVRRIPASPMASTPPPLSCKVPAQVLDVVSGAATVMAPGDVGKVSVKPTPVRSLFKFGFDTVNVSVDVPPARIGLGENNFVMLGGFNTMSPAVALPVDPVFVPPFVDEINPLTF